MPLINEILAATSHRPYEIPPGQWKFYQEWKDALFLHWKVPYDVLRELVPGKLTIDRFEGGCYVGLVAFTMKRIRPRFLPSLSFVSDFHEINVRTYVSYKGKEGVYFINMEAEKHVSAFIARMLSGLPYEKAVIQRGHKVYRSFNHARSFRMDVEFDIKEEIKEKKPFDKWSTERYCLYLERKGQLYRYDVHHKEWGLKNASLTRAAVYYKIGDMVLGDSNPDAIHYSEGVEVIAWQKQKL